MTKSTTDKSVLGLGEEEAQRERLARAFELCGHSVRRAHDAATDELVASLEAMH